MPCEFMIRRDSGVAYFRYWGLVRIPDAEAAIAAYQKHPDYDKKQNRLVDFSEMTSYDFEYLEHMKFQAKITESLVNDQFEMLIVMLAPTKIAMEVAVLNRKAWDGNGNIVIRIAETEKEALRLLGRQEANINDFLAIA